MIRLRGVRLDAPDRPPASAALLDVPELDIRSGEYVVLTGPNGAGKSLLLHVIAGLRKPTGGTVTFDMTNGSDRPRVGILFQNPDDQLLGSTVERDIAFGLESLGVAPAEIRRRIDSAMEEAGLATLARRPPHLLSDGEKQRVVLASVLVLEPAVLLVDEPTSRLDPEGRAHFLERLHAIRARSGATVLHVTHRAEEIAPADRVVALRGGRVVFDGAPAELARGSVAGLGILRAGGFEGSIPLPEDAAAAHGLGEARPAAQSGASEPLVRLEAVAWCSDDGTGTVREVLQGVDLEIRDGERVGITGRSGSGKTTLAAILARLVEPDRGRVVWRESVPDRRPGGRGPGSSGTRGRLPVVLAFQEPERGFFEETVLADIAFGPSNLGIPPESARERARAALRRVGLDPDVFGSRSPDTLSGGEARRAALAGLLALDADLVVLDEPTTGLDGEGVDRLRHILATLRRDGVATLLVSHETALLRSECDRILRLTEGRLVCEEPIGAYAAP